MTRSATALRVKAVRVARGFGDADGYRSPFALPQPNGPLTAVLDALGDASAAWTAAAARSAVSSVRAGALSGIDYLALLCADHRRQLLRDLGVADSDCTFGVSVTGWSLANAVTGGRLLTLSPVPDPV